MGGDSITESNISTLTDSIVLLRYVEMFGEMKRGLTVLKMRGSAHDKAIREFTIGKGGMQMGRAFRNVTGTCSSPAVARGCAINRRRKHGARSSSAICPSSIV